MAFVAPRAVRAVLALVTLGASAARLGVRAEVGFDRAFGGFVFAARGFAAGFEPASESW
ncbi:MAG: hypothetical protein M3065_05755 [Actinomycetota bacterium]|nr:hypothetical protein [Actinomycetota bacterium]